MTARLRFEAALIGLAAALVSGCSTIGGPQDAPGAPIAAAGPAASPAQAAAPVAAAASEAASQPVSAEVADREAEAVAASEVPAFVGPPPPMPTRSQLDPEVDGAHSSLWERIRAGCTMPDLDDEWVRKWEQFYATRPDYVQRMMERGSRYLFHVVEAVHRRGLPMELALLPFVESAFNPHATSRAAASGMWQFMPATGREFELRQNLFRDDRRDILASTTAALDYLERLHARFGDWHLALAAYNWGVGNVQRAVDRQQRAGEAPDYASLRGMPVETREYVRKLQAMKNIVLRPQEYSLALPPLENHPFFVTLPIERDIDVDLVAGLSGLTAEEFRQLNPQLNKPVILAAGTPQVLLPYDNANRFVRALRRHEGPRASWTAWVAPRTLKPAEAAKIVGMREAELREVNGIPARMLVRVGSTLVVPRSPLSSTNVAEHIADNAALSLAPEARKGKRAKVQGAERRLVASRQGCTEADLSTHRGQAPLALNGLKALKR